MILQLAPALKYLNKTMEHDHLVVEFSVGFVESPYESPFTSIYH